MNFLLKPGGIIEMVEEVQHFQRTPRDELGVRPLREGF